jgi:hypothetical protein
MRIALAPVHADQKGAISSSTTLDQTVVSGPFLTLILTPGPVSTVEIPS